MKHNFTRTVLLLVAAVAFLSLIQPAHAATAAGAGIEVEGKHIGGFTITWSKETRENLVEQLSQRPITFERDYKIQVDAKDPKKASLQGRIRLLSSIRGDSQVMATLTRLELVNRDGKWFVESESLKRALKRAKKNGTTENQEAGAPNPKSAAELTSQGV
jgi:hypothetical protein